MAILRKRQIEMLSQLSGEELEQFLKHLPISSERLEDLFDRLHTRLESQPCDDTLHNTMQFLLEKHLPFPKIVGWLNDNGGFCDCRVLENIEPEWEKTFAAD
jgi:Protein of unknown function (DUF2695)